MNKKQLVLISGTVCSSLCSFAGQSTGNSTLNGNTQGLRNDSRKPNIILILGDDIGFSDIGCYGSEIHTPNIDKIAANGVRFTQFYNMSKCNPTRSSLLTGLYLPKKNYKNSISIPLGLKKAGYYTAVAGKEHFDKWVPKRCWFKDSFDDSFYYPVINQYFIPPDGKFKNPFYLNGKKITPDEMPVTDPPFYKTDVTTNYALKFIDKAVKNKKPFFLYLAYNAAHYPLQARKEDIAKYLDVYKAGWDKIREARFEKQKKLGIIPPDCKLSPPEDNINKYRDFRRNKKHLSDPPALREFWFNFPKYRKWNTISKKEQNALALEMAVFAAMVDRMDQNIGRIIKELKEKGVYNNTLIVFCSDNGSCPYYSNHDITIPPGGPDSYRSLHAAWANVGNTPFRYYKQYGHEGGSHTHCIMSCPNLIKQGRITDAVGSVVDFFPTFLELAGVKYPEKVEGVGTPQLDGVSLVPVLKNKGSVKRNLLVSGFTNKFRMVRFGNWKMVKVNNLPWELYNLGKDPSELNNLAGTMPEKLKSMEKAYMEWKQKQHVR